METGEAYVMELNRNHYFVIGVVLILIGIQVRMVDTFVLNKEASDRLIPKPERTLANDLSFTNLVSNTTDVRKTITPAPWIGWLVLSAGAVLTLHALAMPKAAG
jgi:hypothetical protein